jgi:hypothetical protein
MCVVHLLVLCEILPILNLPSNILQEKMAALENAIKYIYSVIQSRLNDANLSVIWTKIKDFSKKAQHLLENPKLSKLWYQDFDFILMKIVLLLFIYLFIVIKTVGYQKENN